MQPRRQPGEAPRPGAPLSKVTVFPRPLSAHQHPPPRGQVLDQRLANVYLQQPGRCRSLHEEETTERAAGRCPDHWYACLPSGSSSSRPSTVTGRGLAPVARLEHQLVSADFPLGLLDNGDPFVSPTSCWPVTHSSCWPVLTFVERARWAGSGCVRRFRRLSPPRPVQEHHRGGRRTWTRVIGDRFSKRTSWVLTWSTLEPAARVIADNFTTRRGASASSTSRGTCASSTHARSPTAVPTATRRPRMHGLSPIASGARDTRHQFLDHFGRTTIAAWLPAYWSGRAVGPFAVEWAHAMFARAFPRSAPQL